MRNSREFNILQFLSLKFNNIQNMTFKQNIKILFHLKYFKNSYLINKILLNFVNIEGNLSEHPHNFNIFI